MNSSRVAVGLPTILNLCCQCSAKRRCPRLSITRKKTAGSRMESGERLGKSGYGVTASADGKKQVATESDVDFIDDPSVLLKSEDPSGSQAARGKQRRIYRWLVLICG